MQFVSLNTDLQQSYGWLNAEFAQATRSGNLAFARSLDPQSLSCDACWAENSSSVRTSPLFSACLPALLLVSRRMLWFLLFLCIVWLCVCVDMPFCCVPGCKNTEQCPGITFFRFPQKKVARKAWVARLKFLREPAPEAKICHHHFEEKYLVLDPKHKIAPHLYPKATLSLTPEAIPTISERTPRPPERVRESSVNRIRRKEREEVSHCAYGNNFE